MKHLAVHNFIDVPVEKELPLFNNLYLCIKPFTKGWFINYRISLKEIQKNLYTFPKREREINEFLRLGCTNRMIARHLEISTKTVKRHTYNLFQKAGAKNRTELSHIEV